MSPHATEVASQETDGQALKGTPSKPVKEAYNVVQSIWKELRLPLDALSQLQLSGEGYGLPSSFKVGVLAQASIALSALAAALVATERKKQPVNSVPSVLIPLDHASVEFKSELLYILDGVPAPPLWGPIAGLYETKDGHISIHDSFPHHRAGALKLLDLPADCVDRNLIAQRVKGWEAVALEKAAAESGNVIYALRSPKQWEALPQRASLPPFPIMIRKIRDSPPSMPKQWSEGSSALDKCIRGLRVLEMTRVVAGPLCGKTLAAHGADVLWINGEHLPYLPNLDRDMARGKRTAFLDIRSPDGREKFHELLKTTDIFIQSFRPGSMTSKGFSPEYLADLNPDIIYGSISAWGQSGPWRNNRGFDSMVQVAGGINVAEAEAFGDGSVSKKLPTQALDHIAGYFLALGVLTGLHRHMTEGGAWEVHVSLAGVMEYLKSLGRYPGKEGFGCFDPSVPADAARFSETRATGFGDMFAVKHSATVDGYTTGWDYMPMPLGTHKPEWLN
ncbi:unnamed protein product [Clonostachys rhizophaga]|uniref:Uncharacterized protein n=1 Tax=Clonostachys rhizophaga TaxID=160324 RepID=A0A9N9VSC0_9HYPO|nr:unnamed protein product [Clonostachys rhizophaga]